MGTYLSTPITDKESQDGGEDGILYGSTAMQGWRVKMEDAHVARVYLEPREKLSLFAVFDGHGGSEVAAFCAQHIADVLLQNEAYQKQQLEDALAQAFLHLDVLLAAEDGQKELSEIVRVEREEGMSTEPEVSIDEVAEQTGLSAVSIRKYVLDAWRKRAAARDEQENGSNNNDEGGEEKEVIAVAVEKEEEEATPHHSCGGGASCCVDAGGKHHHHNHHHVVVEQEDESAVASSSSPSSTRIRKRPRDEKDGEQQQQQSPRDKAAAVAMEKEEEEEEKVVMDVGAPAISTSSSSSSSSENQEVTSATSSTTSSETEEEEEAIRSINFHRMKDLVLRQRPGFDSGCTAVVVLLQGTERLIVANAGDSRCVLSRGGKAVEMSKDHKPDDNEELARIQGAGGSVSEGRVEGNLNLSRAIGDLTYKQEKTLPPERQMISALPDVRTMGLVEEDDFFVVACDGIWNVMSSQEVVDYVREGLRKGGEDVKLSTLCEEICDRCCDVEMGEESDGAGCDNMTMMVVLFRGSGGGQKEEEKTKEEAGLVVGQHSCRVTHHHHHQHHNEKATSPPGLVVEGGGEVVAAAAAAATIETTTVAPE